MTRHTPFASFAERRLGFALAETEFARRLALALEPRSEAQSEAEAGKPELLRLLGELELLVEPVRRPLRRLEVSAARRPQTVMILPGFATAPRRMRYLAQQLEKAGHVSKRWGAGFNWGPTEERFALLEERLIEIHAANCANAGAGAGACAGANGEKIVLLGWSLGGIFARELAKLHPDKIAKVITLGSPFSGSPRANNMWRVYQFITGFRVDEPPVEVDVAVKPPVETIAMWSPRDGAIAPHCAAGLPGERDRAIALNCTHSGYTYNPHAVRAILAELDRA